MDATERSTLALRIHAAAETRRWPPKVFHKFGVLHVGFASDLFPRFESSCLPLAGTSPLSPLTGGSVEANPRFWKPEPWQRSFLSRTGWGIGLRRRALPPLEEWMDGPVKDETQTCPLRTARGPVSEHEVCVNPMLGTSCRVHARCARCRSEQLRSLRIFFANGWKAKVSTTGWEPSRFANTHRLCFPDFQVFKFLKSQVRASARDTRHRSGSDCSAGDACAPQVTVFLVVPDFASPLPAALAAVQAHPGTGWWYPRTERRVALRRV